MSVIGIFSFAGKKNKMQNDIMSGVTEYYVYLGENYLGENIWPRYLKKINLRLHIFAKTKKSEFQGLHHEYLTGS